MPKEHNTYRIDILTNVIIHHHLSHISNCVGTIAIFTCLKSALSGGAEPGSVRVSPRPAAWSLEQECLVHRDTGHLLTVTRSEIALIS